MTSDDPVNGPDQATGHTDPAGADVPGPVRISYVGTDRMWAEWVGQQLGHAGLTTTLELWDPRPGQDLAESLRAELVRADRTVALFSDGYFQAGARGPSDWSAAFASVGDKLNRLVPVVVGPCNVPALPVPLAFVELPDVTEESARRLLLDRVAGAAARDGRVGRAGEFRQPVRFPGNSPAVWGGVPLRNINFTGRDRALLVLRERMTTSVAAVVPSAVQGMGGVGKTQLAIEYAHRFASDYDLVWYIRAEQPTVARDDLARLAQKLDLPASDDLGETVQRVLDALRQGIPYRRWLLIFDNAARPADLHPLLPTGQGHVLVTSRNIDWRSSAEVLEVDVYRRAESVRFMRRRAPHLSEAEANLVAERLGDLPLALEAAGAWLEVTGMPVEEYLRLAETNLPKLLDQVPVILYQREVVMAWAVPMNRLRNERPAAAQLLRLCAFLGSEPIPVSLFIGGQGADESPVQLPAPLHAQLRDPVQRGQILHEIGRYALAKVGHETASARAQTIQLHRVIQGVVRDLLPREQSEELKGTARRLLAAADPGYPDDRATWDRYAALVPHLEPSGAVHDSEDPAVRQLIINLVRYLHRRGEFAASRDLGRQAAKSWRLVLGEYADELNTLNVHLANSLRSNGERDAAREIDEQVLDYAYTQLGPNHRTTVWAANGLAADMRQLGDWRGACELDRDTLQRCRRAFGIDDKDTMRAAHNYAVALRMMGEFHEALELDQDTAQRRRRQQGDTRQPTMLSVNNVARDMRECGRYAEAAEMQEVTFAEYRKLYGDTHPDTLRAMKNFAVSVRKAGDYARSTALARESLELHRQRFGEDHPETLAATTNLANDLRLHGDEVEAKARAQHAHTRFRQTLGSRHPYTLIGANNLAITLRLTGDRHARDLDELTWSAFREVLGEDHPYTLACATNLGSNLYAADDPGASRQLDQEVLDRSRRVRGPDHPYTLACATNLAMDLRAIGERAAAHSLELDTLDRYTRVLGPNHPETTAATARNRQDCDIEPPPM
ncbi:FxSxx-COOH system tetratricopeptide repeat protein [Saccharopolyspora spinosa]|uniref:Tetratricopeptide repeat protein n=1 Tax=Saccharopolyspora spinosa TaxID=60894 RepID=A0A2N3Y6N0_SACSN|nr:FxSxx-COOH system tetratricopeptide repeat protein [Saccharopolyspora spinosa]PKW18594.1 tetratricopeptide repeat protein [Saccharopolyspora spinosa]